MGFSLQGLHNALERAREGVRDRPGGRERFLRGRGGERRVPDLHVRHRGLRPAGLWRGRPGAPLPESAELEGAHVPEVGLRGNAHRGPELRRHGLVLGGQRRGGPGAASQVEQRLCGRQGDGARGLGGRDTGERPREGRSTRGVKGCGPERGRQPLHGAAHFGRGLGLGFVQKLQRGAGLLGADQDSKTADQGGHPHNLGEDS
mmetsp:Transcript_12346/g.34342  ORF Transcript_12346/g.34342 Transcript_12346/m.34342 type:complete len:203 (-) Transcript_12346:2872-3480(-)